VRQALPAPAVPSPAAVVLVAVLALAAALLPGCGRDGKNKDAAAGGGAADALAHTDPPPPAVRHDIHADVYEEHPQVAAFLERFIEVCNAADYAGYRELVATAFTPEPRERFDAIQRALRSVAVEQVEPIELPDLPPPAYLVTCAVELDPEARVALRGTNRRLAILVFLEQGQWRMALAPARLQPRHTQPGDPADEPAEPDTFFPWDVEAP
jgi:hypothetical protein